MVRCIVWASDTGDDLQATLKHPAFLSIQERPTTDVTPTLPHIPSNVLQNILVSADNSSRLHESKLYLSLQLQYPNTLLEIIYLSAYYCQFKFLKTLIQDLLSLQDCSVDVISHLASLQLQIFNRSQNTLKLSKIVLGYVTVSKFSIFIFNPILGCAYDRINSQSMGHRLATSNQQQTLQHNVQLASQQSSWTKCKVYSVFIASGNRVEDTGSTTMDCTKSQIKKG